MPNNEDAILENIISSLNKYQEIAVKFDYNQALQVIAGPGTGKTKVLTSRVAYMLLKHKIRPQNIIVTTFTNKAAKEMIDRLASLLKETDIKVSDLMIGTFHSICMKILTRFGSRIGLPNGWRIADEKEVETIVTDLVKRVPDQIRDYANSRTRKVNLCVPSKNNSDEWVLNAKVIKKIIEKLKTDAIIPESYFKLDEHDPALAYFYKAYQEELQKLNALDFDDLLMFAFILLSKERCLPNIRHVLVDEFQDTNGIQIDLMYLLAKGNHHQSRGVTVVGDPDQSIYAFRNALSHNFNVMSERCPIQISQVILEENYRSSQKILDTSEVLISQQTKGRTKRVPLKAQFDIDFPPVYMKFPTNFLQAPSLIREMLYLKSLPSLFTYNDFAILVRQRRQIKNLEKALIENRIPYKIIKGHAFWEAKEVISMLALIKCVYSDNDKSSIISSLLYPSKGLGQVSADRIKSKIEESGNLAPFLVLKMIGSGELTCDVPDKSVKVVKNFISLIEECRGMLNSPSSSLYINLFNKLYEKSGLKHEYLYVDGKKKSEVNDDDEPNEMNPRHQNILLLRDYFTGNKNSNSTDPSNFKINQQVLSPHEYIREFFNGLSLNTVDNNQEIETEEERFKRELLDREGYVTISTIHSSKGLEWPVVFIPGCDDGIIPCIFNDDTKGASSDSDDDDDDDDHKNGKNKKKSKVNSTDENENEERRMFFVAQTRAKFLLYLSSVESMDEQFPSKASRFLTPGLLATMADDQRVFASIENIKQLYLAMKNNMSIPEQFSLSTLVKDYNKFVENRREFFYWNENIVRDIMRLDLKTNSVDIKSNPFTTAAFQLGLDNKPSNKVRKNQYSPKGKERIKVNKSPGKVYAPGNDISPFKSTYSKKTTFAPQYTPSRTIFELEQNTNPKFAPKVKNNTQSSKPVLNKKTSPKRRLFVSDSNARVSSNLGHDMSASVKSNPDVTSKVSSTSIRATSKVGRKICVSAINIDDNVPLTSQKLEYTSESNSIIDTTAAELLHNPNDSSIDNRPIIASAKILADAVKKSKSTNEGKSGRKPKVKQELNASQFDIFTQLSKAKKKAKGNNSEIIIID
ncbi:hypothetical protein TPHA_0B01310 [Tetrapisispora phaffii CBS 4417]|uniref:DNA 3'-5' helicase n=1 Tax=Tetrapisispora phaffii (strain ATCC 24235 / CBS 4417 / NBRC 1672 / NRRL Y-8282 / UCD 70-5) TaxID=1071381 RepID=G8BP73_TETPH|nr:hypothetical protein TPHA_0B01310 [Tetrapisispora phaffii CBS 4417]CCE61804.1 hypothetical protein TPHA_0B01310 [Tetrapisispora phaffii CBS 4417]